MKRVWTWRTFLGWIALALPAVAHDPGLSTVNVRLHPDRIDVELVLSMKDAAVLTGMPGVGGGDGDGRTLTSEVPGRGSALAAKAIEALEITMDDRPAPIAGVKCSFDPIGNVTLHLRVPGRPAAELRVRSRWLALLPPGHRQFLSIQNAAGAVLTERLLSATSDSATVQFTGADRVAPELSTANSFVNFVGLGFKHILIGYDHLLFLFSLLIVSRKLPDTLKVITCFTLAHSITLALSTCNLMSIPGRVVEPLIAASIVFVGTENLVRGEAPKGRTLLVFAFGLIHGLGFASALRELGIGTTAAGVAVPLLSFNLGVELGQLLVAALLWPLLRMVRERPVFAKCWIPGCSILTALAGGFWLVQRVWFNA